MVCLDKLRRKKYCVILIASTFQCQEKKFAFAIICVNIFYTLTNALLESGQEEDGCIKYFPGPTCSKFC